MTPSTSYQGRTSKKIMRPVMIGSQLLIVNLHVVPDKTAKARTIEGPENMAGKSFDWFQEEQFLEILTSLKPILMSRMNSAPPTSKQNCQKKTKQLKSIANVAVSYNFRKRSIIPGQHFVLQKSENVYCLCGKEVTKKNVNYKSHHIFHETLEIVVNNQIRVGSEKEQSDSAQCVRSAKERQLQNNATSSYFTEQADCLQTSSVKRKKTTLRKIAKKSRIALVELPSYQKSKAVPPENRESQSEASKSRGGKPLTGNTTTAMVIDLEKEPEGLNDVSKVEDLRDDHLKFLVNQMEDYLRTIFRGEVYCRRHEEYKKGGKCRVPGLRYQSDASRGFD